MRVVIKILATLRIGRILFIYTFSTGFSGTFKIFIDADGTITSPVLRRKFDVYLLHGYAL